MTTKKDKVIIVGWWAHHQPMAALWKINPDNRDQKEAYKFDWRVFTFYVYDFSNEDLKKLKEFVRERIKRKYVEEKRTIKVRNCTFADSGTKGVSIV